ncbi:MAG: imidazoleglycerol-phosphate dehydratase [Patescibacteria group bacterium]
MPRKADLKRKTPPSPRRSGATAGRPAEVLRKTRETNINLNINLDGKGKAKARTGISFLDHMLEALGKHASFDLNVQAKGDINVDQHHLAEDLGIALGEGITKALKNKKGIMRAGCDGGFAFPMDETIALAAVDLSGRVKLNFKVKFREKEVGDLRANVIEDFFEGLANGLRANLYIETKSARSTHHQVEAIFKAVGKSLRMATELDQRNKGRIPSTKGKL